MVTMRAWVRLDRSSIMYQSPHRPQVASRCVGIFSSGWWTSSEVWQCWQLTVASPAGEIAREETSQVIVISRGNKGCIAASEVVESQGETHPLCIRKGGVEPPSFLS